MQEFDETKPFRDLLETFESQTPDFDSLFEGEVLGDAPLHQICQSKLAHFKTETPSFDQLFKGQTFFRVAPKRHMIPAWIAISAVAACLALMLMLPEKVAMNPTSYGKMERTEVKKTTFIKRKIEKVQAEKPQKDFLTLELESPKPIKALTIDHKGSQIREKLIFFKETIEEKDSVNSKNITKIKPAQKSNLAVTYERSIEDAYAEAKLKKTKTKRERLTLGSNFNSANRLLSLVNTKSADAYPLQSIAENYNEGYASLEGSSSSFLRSVSVSKNEWEIPENISRETLRNYDAVYSLPINLGLSVSFPLFRRFEIMTGLNYTYMSGIISGETPNYSFDLKQELHYLGIPVKISISILKQGRLGAYAAFGGTIEKGLAGIQNSHVVNLDGETSDWNSKQPVYGFQPSFTGQLGIFYELNNTFNIYIEPGASYFVPNDQPISSRTEEPFNFNLGLGLRYRIN